MAKPTPLRKTGRTIRRRRPKKANRPSDFFFIVNGFGTTTFLAETADAVQHFFIFERKMAL
jgi:hypothetical protein